MVNQGKIENYSVPENLELQRLEILFDQQPIVEFIGIDNEAKLNEIRQNSADFFTGAYPLNHLHSAQNSMLPFMVVQGLVGQESIDNLKNLNQELNGVCKVGLFILYIYAKGPNGEMVKVPWDLGTTLEYNGSFIIGPKDTSTNHLLFTDREDKTLAPKATKLTTSFLANQDHYIISMPKRENKEKSRTHLQLIAQGFVDRDIHLNVLQNLSASDQPNQDETTYHTGKKAQANLEHKSGELLGICVKLLDVWNINYNRELVNSKTEDIVDKYIKQYINSFVG